MNKSKRTVIIAVIIALAALHPIGRAILIFLWPIDPGHEDTVVLVVLVVLLAFVWTRIPKLFKRR